MLEEPFDVTLRVTAVLERLGIEFLVGGSVASSIHGLPRATNDVDRVALIEARHVDDLVSSLLSDFYIDADLIRDAIVRRANGELTVPGLIGHELRVNPFLRFDLTDVFREPDATLSFTRLREAKNVFRA